MKTRPILITFFISLGLFTPQPLTANAKRTYTTTPSSLRGTWYSYQPTYGNTGTKNKWYKMKISKYIFNYNGYKISGKSKAVAGLPGYKLAKHKVPINEKHTIFNGYWMIGVSYTDNTYCLQRVHHKNKIALKELVSDPPQKPSIYYWYHTKSK